MVFLDDPGPGPNVPTSDPAADARWAAMSPEQKLFFALEFQNRAEGLATFAILHGQTRVGFLTSLGAFWDQRAAYVRTVTTAATRKPEPPIPAPEVG